MRRERSFADILRAGAAVGRNRSAPWRPWRPSRELAAEPRPSPEDIDCPPRPLALSSPLVGRSPGLLSVPPAPRRAGSGRVLVENPGRYGRTPPRATTAFSEPPDFHLRRASLAPPRTPGLPH